MKCPHCSEWIDVVLRRCVNCHNFFIPDPEGFGKFKMLEYMEGSRVCPSCIPKVYQQCKSCDGYDEKYSFDKYGDCAYCENKKHVEKYKALSPGAKKRYDLWVQNSLEKSLQE